MRDVLILCGLAAALFAGAFVYELARRGGKLRRSGPWTNQQKEGRS